MRKGVKWKWKEKEKLAFEEVKSILDEANFLINYNPEKPLLLACDASPYGLGAVLSHQMPGGSEEPVTFASRTLTKTERNYSQIEKEALAIVYAVKKFHQYLFGRHFFLYTDHKPLLGLLSELKGIPSMAAAHIQVGLFYCLHIMTLSNIAVELRIQMLTSSANFRQIIKTVFR